MLTARQELRFTYYLCKLCYKQLNIELCESWDFHGGVHLYFEFNCHETVQSGNLLQMFQMDILSLHLWILNRWLRILFYLRMEELYSCEALIPNPHISVHSSIEIPSLPIISENYLFKNLKIKTNLYYV